MSGYKGIITGIKQKEFDTYTAEMKRVADTFGENSNQYREVAATAAEIGQQLIASKKTELELEHSIKELDHTFREMIVENMRKFVDKLGAFVSLAEKRGTNPALGYRVTESMYTDQIKYNNKMFKEYDKIRTSRIAQIEDEILNKGLQRGSERYQELYGKLTDAETEMINLVSANEDLKESIRTLRWKPFEDLKRQIENSVSDITHLKSLIRDEEMLDKDGQFTDRGYANIALISSDMNEQVKQITMGKAALKKLDQEYKNGTINLEKYNEEVDAQIDLIQNASSAFYEDQKSLADLQIKQWEKEVDILQELIDKRNEALDRKKA